MPARARRAIHRSRPAVAPPNSSACERQSIATSWPAWTSERACCEPYLKRKSQTIRTRIGSLLLQPVEDSPYAERVPARGRRSGEQELGGGAARQGVGRQPRVARREALLVGR